MITLLLAAILPLTEMEAVKSVATEYGLDREQTALLAAIRKVENGKPGLEFGVAQYQRRHPARRHTDGKRSFVTQARWAAGTIKRRYDGNIARFAKRYCPHNHANWAKAVGHYAAKAMAELD